MLLILIVYDIILPYAINVLVDSGLLYSTLGQTALALDSLNMAAKYHPQDYSIFLLRAEIYEKVLCLCLFAVSGI